MTFSGFEHEEEILDSSRQKEYVTSIEKKIDWHLTSYLLCWMRGKRGMPVITKECDSSVQSKDPLPVKQKTFSVKKAFRSLS